MPKVFISQPMTGKSFEEITNERKSLVEQFNKNEFEVIDSVIDKIPNVKNSGLYCLGKSLKLLSDADVAIFMDGWQTARGCWIEHECCIRYNIPIIYQNDYESLS